MMAEQARSGNHEPHVVRMMDDERKSGAVAGHRPLQHLPVAISVAERRNWTTADKLVDAHRLLGLVIDEVDLGRTYQDRLPVAHL